MWCVQWLAGGSGVLPKYKHRSIVRPARTDPSQGQMATRPYQIKGIFLRQRHLITVISPEGAHRIPKAYDTHPNPIHLKSLFNHLNRSLIDLSRPPTTSNDLQ